MSLGAIRFMSIRNKSLRTLVNPNFCSADTWSRFIFILEALFSQTAPINFINSVLFPLLENTFSRSVYYWARAAGNIHVEKSTVSTNSIFFLENQSDVSLEFLNRNVLINDQGDVL